MLKAKIKIEGVDGFVWAFAEAPDKIYTEIAGILTFETTPDFQEDKFLQVPKDRIVFIEVFPLNKNKPVM